VDHLVAVREEEEVPEEAVDHQVEAAATLVQEVEDHLVVALLHTEIREEVHHNLVLSLEV
jgi:hypothetical protein